MENPIQNNTVCAFTICSNNYLAQATVLGKSLREKNPGIPFSIILTDRRSDKIAYDELKDFDLIHIEEIYPPAAKLAEKYKIIEFSTAVKPLVFQYFFSKPGIDTVLYFDPDIRVYNRLDPVLEELGSCQVVLTPHILTPIPQDGFYPDDNAFLKYGIYNLGFLGVRRGKESSRMLDWWKQHTFSKGYINTQQGQFTDQLPMGLVPLFFKEVKILAHPGLNMAPWNLHERFLENNNGEYRMQNGDKLVFYHFSDFKPTEPLTISKNGWYNRFTLEKREDLQTLYAEYYQDLLKNNYEAYSKLSCYFYPDQKTKKSFRKFLIRVFEKMISILKK